MEKELIEDINKLVGSINSVSMLRDNIDPNRYQDVQINFESTPQKIHVYNTTRHLNYNLNSFTRQALKVAMEESREILLAKMQKYLNKELIKRNEQLKDSIFDFMAEIKTKIEE